MTGHKKAPTEGQSAGAGTSTAEDTILDSGSIADGTPKVKHLLHALGISGQLTWQCFDDSAAKRRDLARIMHKTIDEALPALRELNAAGAGVFFMVNEGDLEGRTAKNIVAVRALFADLDGAPLEPITAFALKPHAIVESSPGRWHAYWRVVGVPLDQFSPAQKALAEMFGGDPTVHDLPRVMRVPGFLHQKGAAFETRVIETGDHAPFVWQEFKGHLRLSNKPPAQTAAEPIGDRIPAGSRNNTLKSLAGSMQRRGMSEDAIFAALKTENDAKCDPPLDDAEVRAIVASTVGYPVPTKPFLATDIGLGQRFAAMHDGAMRYVYPWDSWLSWDGMRWLKDEGEVVEQRAKQTADALIEEGLAARAIDEGKLLKWAIQCQGRARIEAMIKMAQSEKQIVLSTKAIDAKPYLLNLANGTFDTESMTLRPHDPSDFLTKLAPVEFDAEARCPTWLKFIERILPDPDVRTFVQRAVGYSLTADITENCFFVLHGDGENGKSTFIETIRALLGDYAAPTEFRTLTKRRDDDSAVRNDLAHLFGKRMVTAVESNKEVELDEALIKQLTGGDTVKVRFLFKEFFDFLPQFKVWLASNYKPKIRGTDLGIWRRVRLIPFDQKITREEKDLRMKDRLLAELPGTLMWAIEGLRQWKAEGLPAPAAVQAATKAYRKESDVFGPFYEACVVADKDDFITGAELRAAVERWSRDHDQSPPDDGIIAARMKAAGHSAQTAWVKRLKAHVHAYRGIRLLRSS